MRLCTLITSSNKIKNRAKLLGPLLHVQVHMIAVQIVLVIVTAVRYLASSGSSTDMIAVQIVSLIHNGSLATSLQFQ